MTEPTEEQLEPTTVAATTTERTVAFFAAPRAATLLLPKTVSRLVDSLQIDRALIDLSTLAGIEIARTFEGAGLPYDSIEFGQTDHFAPFPAAEGAESSGVDAAVYEQDVAATAQRVRARAERVVTIGAADLGTIDANVVLIPAILGDGEPVLAFTEGTVLGALVEQLQAAKRDFILIDAPERGLQGLPDGDYLRRVVHVDANLD